MSNNLNESTFSQLSAGLQEKINKVNPGGVNLYELEKDTNLQGREIPNINDPQIQQSFNVDRTKTRYTGLVQLGKQRERKELYDLLLNQDLMNNINGRNKFANIDADDIEVIKYIPNSRLAYVNALIKEGIRTGLSPCDAQVANTIWMSDVNKNKLTKILNKLVVSNKKDLTLVPSNRSGVKYTCNDNVLQGNFYNPGVVDIPNSQYRYNAKCGCDDNKIASDLEGSIGHIAQIIDKYQSEMEYAEDDRVVEQNFGTNFAKLFHWARDTALSGMGDFKRLLSISKAFHETEKVIKASYLSSLIEPFKYRNEVRIPSTIPIPTAAFSVTRNLPLITNASGNVAFAISPAFLNNTGSFSTCGINNSATLLGNADDNFFLAVDLGQSPPSQFYTRYRLVSAGVRLLFTSSNLNSTGFCTASVDFNTTAAQATGTAIAPYTRYGNFSNTENGAFKQTSSVSNGSMLQINYIPVDSSSTDFVACGTPVNGFVITGYITGAPASTNVARMDVVFNYEAFVNQTFTDYIPTASSFSNDDPDMCKSFINRCSTLPTTSPRDMYSILPPNYKINANKDDVLAEIPTEPIRVVNPINKENTKDMINTMGKEVIGALITDKLKDKSWSQKLDIMDKLQLDRLRIGPKDIKSPGALSILAPATAMSGGALGTALSIGSKVLPFMI